MSWLRPLWPNAPADLVEAIEAQSTELFAKYKLNNPLRVAHFMAQISHESDGGTIRRESLYYTHPERLASVWPTRFTVENAGPYLRNPQALGNFVYNGRMGNAPGSNDGYLYLGRGLLQLTGKDSYTEVGRYLGQDLVAHPELAYDVRYTLECALIEFCKILHCLPHCDEDELVAVSRLVNTGTLTKNIRVVGLEQRREWLQKWKTALAIQPGTQYNQPEDLPLEPKDHPMADTPSLAAPSMFSLPWIIARMKEPSTYAGLAVLIPFVAPMLHIDPSVLTPAIQNFGIGLAGLLAVVLHESA